MSTQDTAASLEKEMNENGWEGSPLGERVIAYLRETEKSLAIEKAKREEAESRKPLGAWLIAAASVALTIAVGTYAISDHKWSAYALASKDAEIAKIERMHAATVQGNEIQMKALTEEISMLRVTAEKLKDAAKDNITEVKTLATEITNRIQSIAAGVPVPDTGTRKPE